MKSMGEHAEARGRRVVTQRDVAEAAGVDRATVSRALDPKKRLLISPETAQRVLDAAERLGYRTNLLARGLRTSRSGVIGLEIPTDLHASSSVFDKPLSTFVTSIEERLAVHGLTLLVTFAHSKSPSRSAHTLDAGGMIDGVISLQTHNEPATTLAQEVPAVTVGFDPTGGYDLVIGEGRGIEMAVEHLARLGHRRIGLVSEPMSVPRGGRHVRAYREAMGRIGLAATEVDTLIAHYHERHPASAPQAVETLLTRAAGLTAIVFTDDKAAMGGYGVLRSAQIPVPHQISVVGWRDNDAGMYLLPPLTTVALPMRPTAFAATELLLRRIGDEPQATAPKRQFTPYLIQRASTAPPAKWFLRQALRRTPVN